ncbi:hypothetical protein [Leptospira noguchii]|nr:hypothetical protein [Leptospira noguchii]
MNIRLFEYIFLNRRSQEGRWQIDCSLNSAQSFPMGRNSGGKV